MDLGGRGEEREREFPIVFNDFGIKQERLSKTRAVDIYNAMTPQGKSQNGTTGFFSFLLTRTLVRTEACLLAFEAGAPTIVKSVRAGQPERLRTGRQLARCHLGDLRDKMRACGLGEMASKEKIWHPL